MYVLLTLMLQYSKNTPFGTKQKCYHKSDMKTPSDTSTSQKGFTLLELLVVAVALIIFITLLIVITE